MSRQWYEVRIRVKVRPERYIKKSKFYLASSSGEAAKKYKGNGYIMSVQKSQKEKLFGIGGFFTMGDSLLKEFSKGGGLLEQVKEKEKSEVRKKRGYYARQRKETTS